MEKDRTQHKTEDKQKLEENSEVKSLFYVV
jgi:hypothetical protein